MCIFPSCQAKLDCKNVGKCGGEKQAGCINFRSDVQQCNVEEWLFWVYFLEFLLSVEFMEPGQLSISLYSVCKISDLNTEPSLWLLGFFSTTSLPSVRIMSVHYVFGFIFKGPAMQTPR